MDDVFANINLDLLSEEAQKGAQEYVESLCDEDDSVNAFWFQRNFSLLMQRKAPRLSPEHPEVAKIYDRLLQQCQWVALPLLTENVIIDLFEKHLVLAFDWKTLQWHEKIKQALIIESDYDARDRKKKVMRDALLRNNEVFTQSELVVDGKSIPGSVQQWIRDYLRAVGVKGGTKVAFAEYMTSGTNARKLSEDDRNRLKRLLEAFERLGKSSTTVEGIEEVIPVDDPKNPGVIRGGVFEPLNPEVVKSTDALRAIRDAVLGVTSVAVVAPSPIKSSSLVMEELQKTKTEIDEQLLGDPQAFIRALDEAVARKDVIRVGALLLAARRNAALKSLLRVQEVKQLVYYDLKTKQFQWK